MTTPGETVSIDDWPPHAPVYLDVDWIDMTGAPGTTPTRLDYDLRALWLSAGVPNRR